MIYTVLGVVIILQAVIHFIERRDLYNRIMCKNLTEYKGERCTSAKSAHDRIIRKWRGKKDGEE